MRGFLLVSVVLSMVGCASCSGQDDSEGSRSAAGETPCQFVSSGTGSTGTVALKAEKVVTGLEVPWGIAFLQNGDWLVAERPGRVRLVRGGQLIAAPVATLTVGEGGEGGLLGIAANPRSADEFVVFYTFNKSGSTVNRVERYRLSSDHKSASSAGILLDDIPAGSFHDGGRIKFGPDGKLYVGTGDARNPDSAQDPSGLNGKILRMNADGSGREVFASGLRNPEAFDWVNSGLMIVADHGPTGELGLSGCDEVSFASRGSNLGWPLITGCQTRSGLINPIVSWNTAAPPGGGVIYRGNAIPEFKGNFLVGMLGMSAGTAHQLHRIVFDADSQTMVTHEAYLQGQFGRLRDVTQAPDGTLYITTSNCDTRGTCPADGDSILRITR